MPPKPAVVALVPPPEDDEVCDLDFGTVPLHLLEFVMVLGRCMACGYLVARHDFAAPVAAAAGAAVQAPQRTAEEKKLQSLQDAQAMVRTFRSAYRHEYATPHMMDMARSFRHADAGHLGLLGCASLVTGDLPERPSREMLLKPWERAVLYAFVIEAVCLCLAALMHMLAAGAAIPRSSAFSDARANAPDLTHNQAAEALRGLSAMALGLRAGSIRDPIVYARRYADSSIKLVHPVVGSIHPLIFNRTTGLDRLRAWMLAFRDGLALPTWEVVVAPLAAPAAAAPVVAAAAAAAAQAAACVVDLAVWGRQWPWIGIGEAIVSGMGMAAQTTAPAAWEALETSESLVASALKILNPDGTGDADQAAPGLGSAQKKRRRADSRAAQTAAALAASAGGLGAGQGGMAGGGAGGRGRGAAGRGGRGARGGGAGAAAPAVTAARQAARTRLAAKAVGDLDKADCLDAALCFVCKHPRHDAATACVARGTAI
jgi:hypothetical protein